MVMPPLLSTLTAPGRAGKTRNGGCRLLPSSRLCSDRVRHGCSPRAHGFWSASGRIADCLMLGFRIEFSADQYHDDRQPNPNHECDDGAERTISLVIVAKTFRIPRK